MSQIVMELELKKLKGVSRTMLLTIRARVEEQEHHPNPFFQDQVAVDWWEKYLQYHWDRDKELKKIYKQILNFQNGVAMRVYHYDQIASSFIADHPNPVVVELGAGLSTRFYRIGQNVYRWLELDLPMVTDLRCKLDTETEQHQFIGASVMDFGWMNAVPNVASENILFIAEGLLMYFEANEVHQLISQMRSRFPGATLVMDVVGNSGKLYKKVPAQIGAPIKWYVKNELEVVAMGLNLINVWRLYKLYPERGPWLLRLILRLLTQLPYFGNAYLILETRLAPS